MHSCVPTSEQGSLRATQPRGWERVSISQAPLLSVGLVNHAGPGSPTPDHPGLTWTGARSCSHADFALSGTAAEAHGLRTPRAPPLGFPWPSLSPGWATLAPCLQDNRLQEALTLECLSPHPFPPSLCDPPLLDLTDSWMLPVCMKHFLSSKHRLGS